MRLRDAQPAPFEQVADLGHRAGGAVAEIADDGIGLVDQHPATDLELCAIDAGVDIGVVFGAADEDGGDALAGRAKEDANAIGRRGDL